MHKKSFKQDATQMHTSKPIKKLKTQILKLLNHEKLTFLQISQPKQQKWHVHNRLYAIKEGQIRQPTQSYVLNLAGICV